MQKLLCLVLCVSALAGCAKKTNELVGTWTTNRGAATTVFHFFPDNKLKAEMTFESVKAKMEGTYDLDGENLSMTMTKVDTTGPELLGNQLKAELMKPGTLPIEWKTPTSFQMKMADSKEAMSFTLLDRKP